MKQMRLYLLVLMVLLSWGLSLGTAWADNNEITEGKEIIEAKTLCASLNEEQMEAIGEYYMEQMHPVESHELMHQMMGLKESADAERQFHINMARIVYCGESGGLIMPMGQMMQGMMGGGGMMSGQNSMMGGMMGGNSGGMMASQGGMMGSNTLGYTMSYWSWWNVLWYVFWIAVIVGLVIVLVKILPSRGQGEKHGRKH